MKLPDHDGHILVVLGQIRVFVGQFFLKFWPNCANTLSEVGQLEGVKMAEIGQAQSKKTGVVATKRGVPIYQTNPSIPATSGMGIRQKRYQVPGGKASIIMDNGTGEIHGIGGMALWWQEEVDTTRFVKLFLDGIKQAAGLSRTGIQVFELVYHQIRENPGTDKIELNQYLAADHGMSDRTFRRGLRELLDKEFLFRTPSDGLFFVNIRFMFNGDRLAFVKTYYLKGAAQQQELPFQEVPALPAPAE